MSNIEKRDNLRECRRQAFGDYSGDLWFIDTPTAVPFDDIVAGAKPGDNKFLHLSEWLSDRMVEWTTTHLQDVQYAKTESGLLVPRMSDAEAFEYMSLTADKFRPGFAFMSYALEAVPSVCAAQGMSDPEDWLRVAHNSVSFAARFATNNTTLQGTMQVLLIDGVALNDDCAHLGETESRKRIHFDPSSLGVIDGSITTIQGDERLKRHILHYTKRLDEGGMDRSCVALQQKYKDSTIFDAFWGMYCEAAKTYYPKSAQELPSAKPKCEVLNERDLEGLVLHRMALAYAHDLRLQGYSEAFINEQLEYLIGPDMDRLVAQIEENK